MELLTVNNVWMMICTALVFFMHLGFSFLEIGLTRQKNTINILFKNFFVITAGLIIYCLIGFNLMYPGDWIIEGVLGTIVPGLDSVAASDLSYNEGYTYWTDFLFQGMFAATAATIISGAVAERIKINSFILIAILYVTIVYPIVGSWQWGGGFFSNFVSDDFKSNREISKLFSEKIEKLKFSIGRLKTGTPPRILKKSINFNDLQEQLPDSKPVPFSFINRSIHTPQISCFITHTNKETHKIIEKNLI